MGTMTQGRIAWHVPLRFVNPDDRREKYEQRLALEWCRTNGDPHLETGSKTR